MGAKLTTKVHLEEAASRLKALIGDLAIATSEALEETNTQISEVESGLFTISYDADTTTLTFVTNSQSQGSE